MSDREPYVSVNQSNDVPEHVVEEALRLGFRADTGISFRREEETCESESEAG